MKEQIILQEDMINARTAKDLLQSQSILQTQN